MGCILDKVGCPKDLRELNLIEKKQLACDLRQMVLETVSETGGHLASNLGVVELTIALHSVYDTPNDVIIWDVGHQTYIHKILTERKEQFKTLRQLNGIAGFPKTSESCYDAFNTGHSSTSISVALGMARARDIKNEDKEIIAIIGDGALTGGMAQEALNDAGASKTNITVVLNDNEMSISKNVGGVSLLLSKLRAKKLYTKTNIRIKRVVGKIPVVGNTFIHIIQKIKRSIKQILISKMYFEDIGFTYLGPVDGHDIEKLESILKVSKTIRGPKLIHVITKKGKGYKPAENNPDKFHSTSSFNLKTGESKKTKKDDYSKIFGDTLVKLAKGDPRIVAVTAAMADGTGLTEFRKQFSDRFFDVGIAEQHALGMVAGMAKSGLKPVIPLYSSFYQRGYDQVIHDIALQNLPVVMCVDRAGIVGNDGETHQGLLDMAMFNLVPNLVIMAPKDFEELEQMLEFAINLDKPVLIRYPRGGEGINRFNIHQQIEIGKAEIIKQNDNSDITIIAIGKMVERAVEVAEKLEKQGQYCDIINSRFLKPLDEQTILNSIIKTKKVITIEDGILKNGLGSSVIEIIQRANVENIKIKTYGYDDKFVQHGTVEELEKLNGLDAETITKESALATL